MSIHTDALAAGLQLPDMLIHRTEVTAADRMGATDANCTRIVSIDALDCLGYRGRGREEHSGENPPLDPDDLLAELADNRPAQVRWMRSD